MIPIDGAKFVTLKRGAGQLFRVVHHYSADQAISIRSTANPSLELASVRVANGSTVFAGDSALWKEVEPTALVTTPSGRQKAVLIEPIGEQIIDIDISWFCAENYDLGYQRLVDCISVLPLHRIIVSVQRSSELVVIDSESNQRSGAIHLAGRYGSPALQMGNSSEFFASDYDTLCRVDCKSLLLSGSKRLQAESQDGYQQFIGDYGLEGGRCIVTRPFSGDVIIINLNDFSTIAEAHTGDQPLSACQISETEILARDWKTGKVLFGSLRPKSR